MTIKSKSVQLGLGLTLFALGAALPAASATTEPTPGWAVWEGHDPSAPLAIYTESSNQTGALLVCDATGSMRVLLTIEPGSIPKLLKRQVAYARGTESVITVGEGEPATTTFRYAPATNSIETKSHSVAAKVFNAAVLGETLTVKTKREGTIETNLPAPDEAFKAFAKTCEGLRSAEES